MRSGKVIFTVKGFLRFCYTLFVDFYYSAEQHPNEKKAGERFTLRFIL